MCFNPTANTKNYAVFNLSMEKGKTKILIQLRLKR
jgi:hypothetical protein